jgi:hypothetical protein
MRKPPKALYFESDIYRQDYYFLIGWNKEQVEKTLKVSVEGGAGATMLQDGTIYIWLHDISNPESLSELSHECVHAANMTLGARGIVVSADDDEALAYLVQWIFQNCYRVAKKRIKR